MEKYANMVIDCLGGVSAVSKMTGWPVSTIHSWRSSGIPDWRLPLLQAAARKAGKKLPESSDES